MIKQVFDQIPRERLIDVCLLWKTRRREWLRTRISTFINDWKRKVSYYEFSEKKLSYEFSDCLYRPARNDTLATSDEIGVKQYTYIYFPI
jgi:hypothetical protein